MSNGLAHLYVVPRNNPFGVNFLHLIFAVLLGDDVRSFHFGCCASGTTSVDTFLVDCRLAGQFLQFVHVTVEAAGPMDVEDHGRRLIAHR